MSFLLNRLSVVAHSHAGEPKHHPECNPKEQAAIVQYGSDFLEALQPVIASAPKNGAFITSCICHGCPWSTITTGTAGDTKTSYNYYAAWHSAVAASPRGQKVGAAEGGGSTIHIDSRAPNGGGELKNPMCVPFP